MAARQPLARCAAGAVRTRLATRGGNELKMKFCAVHSSCALAVNTFAPFKDRPGDLVLLGQSGFEPPTFEKELPSGLRGTPPTLDVFLCRGSEVIAIESKFTEYFNPQGGRVHLQLHPCRPPAGWGLLVASTGRLQADRDAPSRRGATRKTLPWYQPTPGPWGRDRLAAHQEQRCFTYSGNRRTPPTSKHADNTETKLQSWRHRFPDPRCRFRR